MMDRPKHLDSLRCLEYKASLTHHVAPVTCTALTGHQWNKQGAWQKLLHHHMMLTAVYGNAYVSNK